LKHERDILATQVAESGKPANIVAKIVEGRMKKFFAENTLLNQVLNYHIFLSSVSMLALFCSLKSIDFFFFSTPHVLITNFRQPHMIEDDSPVVKVALQKMGQELGVKLSLDGFALYRTGK
jgi:hypothetical protein